MPRKNPRPLARKRRLELKARMEERAEELRNGRFLFGYPGRPRRRVPGLFVFDEASSVPSGVFDGLALAAAVTGVLGRGR